MRAGPDMGPPMYEPRMDAFLNRWFTSYAAARRSLDSDGDFLLPYEEQFFVTAAWERLRLQREVAI